MKYALPAIVAALLTAGCASTCPQVSEAKQAPPPQTEADAEGVPMLKDIPLLAHMFKHGTEKTVEVAEPNGVPLLADIPILGHLFKRSDKPAETPEAPVEPGE